MVDATVRLRRAEAACRALAPAYAGYERKSDRLSTDEATRLAAADSVRSGLRALARAQEQLSRAGRLDETALLQRLIVRSRHTAEVLAALQTAPSPRHGAWLGARSVPAPAALALALADRGLLEVAREYADTAREQADAARAQAGAARAQAGAASAQAGAASAQAGAARAQAGPSGELSGELAGDWQAVADALASVRRRYEERDRLLASSTAPVAPAADDWRELRPGDRLSVEGKAYDVLARARWPGDDITLDLSDSAAELEAAAAGGPAPAVSLVLWLPASGEAVAFDAERVIPPTGADAAGALVGAETDELRVARRDAGPVRRTDGAGRTVRTAERLVYEAPSGVWLWIESEGAETSAMRGLAVGPDELEPA